MIKLQQTVKFDKTKKFLQKINKIIGQGRFDYYGKVGVQALKDATPKDTGVTADSWFYTITKSKEFAALTFHNSNVVDGVPIAVILQYGHGTRNGGYVQGRDYINPALRPIFDKMSRELWEEVTSL